MKYPTRKVVEFIVLSIALISMVLAMLCSCSPKSDLPPGYEIIQSNTGWYLRTNGVSLMQQAYVTRDEAVGQAWTWAGRAKHQPEQGHFKVDAVLSVAFVTNMVKRTIPEYGELHSADGHWTTNAYVEVQEIRRQVWIAFDLGNYPFKGLVQESVITNW